MTAIWKYFSISDDDQSNADYKTMKISYIMNKYQKRMLILSLVLMHPYPKVYVPAQEFILAPWFPDCNHSANFVPE